MQARRILATVWRWLVKVETHYMHGTAALASSLNDNQPLNSLKPDWALFTVKTTAYF